MSTDEFFNLNDDELLLANSKNGSKNRLGFAVLLKYFQLEGHYPKHVKFIDPVMLSCIANQLDVLPSRIDNFDWEGRSTERFRSEIREFLGYKKATLQDAYRLKSWLAKEVFPNTVKRTEQIAHAYEYFLKTED